MPLPSRLLLILLTVAFFACGRPVQPPPPDYTREPVRTVGAVQFFAAVPAVCPATRGIKQKTVRRVTTEQELRDHYGLTFAVRFNDGVSPTLYGSIYYQNRAENRYCMALVNGSFAVFADRKIGVKRNVIQEVCYPIQPCTAPSGG